MLLAPSQLQQPSCQAGRTGQSSSCRLNLQLLSMVMHDCGNAKPATTGVASTRAMTGWALRIDDL